MLRARSWLSTCAAACSAAWSLVCLGQSPQPAPSAHAVPPARARLSAPVVLDDAQVVQRLVAEAQGARGALQFARELTDHVGPRPTGSPAALRAVEWAERTMLRIGLRDVRREPFDASTWPSASDVVEVTSPTPQRLSALLLAYSKSGVELEAEVLFIESSQELRQARSRVPGKIVVVGTALAPTRDFEGFMPTARLQAALAREAVALGASGVLLRSAGTGYHRLPHQSTTFQDPRHATVPELALAAEDAELLRRLNQSGAVRVRIVVPERVVRPARDWNVVGEIRGVTRPDEIVLLSAHLDSWDTGTGALDDAAGCGIVLDVARAWTALALRPRRTLRVVLFGNEELQGAGARAYIAAHRDELASHVAALEADSGAGAPTGYLIAGAGSARTTLDIWAALLQRWVPREITTTPLVGPDLIGLQAAHVPVLGVAQDLTTYFEWHHTAADTFDKIDPETLARAAGAWSGLVWAVANSDRYLPPPLQPRW
jgi:carboxypeptidase Q